MQGVFAHDSIACKGEMTFAVYVAPQATHEPRPVLWYLSGLTCTHANVMEKGEYRRLASELGPIVVCPDTSRRGQEVPDEPTNWQMGKGAGLYLDATEEPWAEQNRMYTYITEEQPALEEQTAASHCLAQEAAELFDLLGQFRYNDAERPAFQIGQPEPSS